MNSEQSDRYKRQIQLPEIGSSNQQALLDAHVGIIGLGGLGSPVAQYLAAAGVGQLSLVDFDTVDRSNLQRQIIHFTDDIGKLKVDSAAQTIQALNPEIQVHRYYEALEKQALLNFVQNVDAIVDCCDNFTTRFELNEACFTSGTPLVSGAVIRFEGQVSVFNPQNPQSPCYQCLYTPSSGEEGEPCSLTGVLAAAPGIIGSIQATETIKLLIGLPTLMGKLLLMDAKQMEWRTMQIPKDSKCPVCSQSRNLKNQAYLPTKP